MITLKQGDCLELMKDIPDNSIDLILCDLPYGTTANKWDCVIDFAKLWEQYQRIGKERCIYALFAQPPFDKLLGASNIKYFKYEWIWRKNIATGFLNANHSPLKAHENILIFYRKLGVFNQQRRAGFKNYTKLSDCCSDNYSEYKRALIKVTDGSRCPIDILEFNCERGLHPTQKPVALLEYLIKTYTNEGDLVLDNCMGSGSTGVACINTNRNFIGYELDQKYFEIAKNRINEAELKLMG